MSANCGMRRARRLLLLTALTALGSLVLSAPAFAEGGLTSIVGGALPETGTSLDQAVDDNLEAAAPILDTASPVVDTASPVLDAATPVVEATKPVVQETTAPVLQAAAPVLDAAAPVLETTAPVLETTSTLTAPVLDTTSTLTAPVLETTSTLTAPVTESISEATAPTFGAGSTADSEGGAGTTPEMAPGLSSDVDTAVATEQAVGATGSSTLAASSSRRGLPQRIGRHSTDPRPSPLGTPSFDTWSSAVATARESGGRPEMSAKAPGTPNRHWPSVPSAPSSVAAGLFGGGGLLVLGALAAILLLTAPGMGRRLRLVLVSPPLSVALPSLERPG
jgi:cell wall-associated NlpC family hydrolase